MQLLYLAAELRDDLLLGHAALRGVNSALLIAARVLLLLAGGGAGGRVGGDAVAHQCVEGLQLLQLTGDVAVVGRIASCSSGSRALLTSGEAARSGATAVEFSLERRRVAPSSGPHLVAAAPLLVLPS